MGVTLSAAISSNLRKRDRRRADAKQFKALIATPKTTFPFGLPANGRLSVVSRTGCAAGTTMMTVVSRATRTLKSRLLAAGARQTIGVFDEDVQVSMAAGFDLYVDSTGFGKWRKIAQGA